MSKKAKEKPTGKRLGKVYIPTKYVVDLDNESMVDEARECMIEDIMSAIKHDEMPYWVDIAEDNSLSESDIPDFLKHEEEIEDETVDVIASGYEWECPHCDMLNHEIELAEFVTCSNCYKHFNVTDFHHAYGNH